MAINKTFMKLLRLGITPDNALGSHKDSETMFKIDEAFSIEWSVDDLSYYEETGDHDTIIDSVRNLILVQERHTDIIHCILGHLERKLKKPVWVTANAGKQLSVTFGDDNGSIADLMLSFKSDEAFDEFKQEVLQMGLVEDESQLNEEDLSSMLLVILVPDYKKHFEDFSYPDLKIHSLDDDDFFGSYDDEEDDEDD